MSQTLRTQEKFLATPAKTIFAGATASLLTQPFEVLKTNMINSPSLYFKDLHSKIIKGGWGQYMRGGTLSVVRQGYGFAVYTSMINQINRQLDEYANFNKYYKYSIAALLGKMTALFFEAPLTLLKTRMEIVSSSSIKQEINHIMKNPREEMLKGLKATVAREGVFSLIHYNSYRFFKDDILNKNYGIESTFCPAFLAGLLAITISQPFEVIRSLVSLEKNLKIADCGKKILSKHGWRGFFMGYTPRLLRKPINSGICWTVLETVKE